ncbi:MAG: signal peptide peptidase SppA [Planctomycetes bacterium]|nr:signal peptide peptidase SppA [Planctomycetota bacterium]
MTDIEQPTASAGRPSPGEFSAFSTPPSPPPPIYVQMPKQRGVISWLLRRLVVTGLLFSIGLNIWLAFLVAATQAGSFSLETIRDGQQNQQVAVYEVVGIINAKQAMLFDSFVRQIEEDANVKGVVIRVDSPGGGVSASDQINRGVLALKQAGKRVVVSMGSVAASGGYYISAPADHIFAEPTTATGSIGVLGIYPILKGTLDKIGMQVLIIRSTKAEKHKATLNEFEYPTPEGMAEKKVLLDQIHEIFMDVVKQGRVKLSSEEVEALSDGRVWLGADAVKAKLVDEIGYLDDAIDKAAGLAGLSSPRVVRYSRRLTLRESMFGDSASSLRIDIELIEKLQTPRIMLLWRPE